MMDQGKGLLEHIILVAPKRLRPTPQQANAAREFLGHGRVQSLGEVFVEMKKVLSERAVYTFKDEAAGILSGVNDDFIAEVNEAVLLGTPMPTSNMSDIIQRVSVSLHIFNHVVKQLLDEVEPTPLPTVVPRESLQRAIKYIGWANSQKKIFVEVRLVYFTGMY